MLVQAKIVFTFNKLFYDLLHDVKEASSELRSIVKKTYKVKDMTNPSNFESFLGSLPDAVVSIAASSDQFTKLVTDTECSNVEVFKGVTVGDISKVLDHNTLASYLYCFIILAHVYDTTTDEVASSEEASDTLFDTVMGVVSGIQHKQNVDNLMEEILDDEIKNTLINLKGVMNLKPVNANTDKDNNDTNAANANANEPELPPGFENIANMLENSKIASLAKEITDDIDLSKIKVDKPEDMFKVIADQNIMGEIIGKVGNKIQQKLQHGDIKQEDFVKEAMSMLGSMKGNPLFANVMKSMNQGEMRKMSTRERLRKKYEQKNTSSHA